MLDYVSAKNLLHKLEEPDYIFHGQIDLSWHEYVTIVNKQ